MGSAGKGRKECVGAVEEQFGALLVIVGAGDIREQMSGARVQRDLQIRMLGLHASGRIDIALVHEEWVPIHRVDLNRHVVRPRAFQLARVNESGDEKSAAGSGRGLEQLLCGHDTERESGVHHLTGERSGGRQPPLYHVREPDPADEVQPGIDRVEGLTPEEVRGVHLVPTLTQSIREGFDTRRQALDVVKQHGGRHGGHFTARRSGGKGRARRTDDPMTPPEQARGARHDFGPARVPRCASAGRTA